MEKSSNQNISNTSSCPYTEDSPILSRYLSKCAHEFLFSKAEKEDKNIKIRKKTDTVLVYVVCPDHLYNEAELVEKLWKDVFTSSPCPHRKRNGYRPTKHAIVQHLKPNHFSKENTIAFTTVESKNGDEAPDQVDVVLLASLRGAGFLYGYPSCVFYGNSISASFVCTNSDATVVGYGGGLGIGPSIVIRNDNTLNSNVKEGLEYENSSTHLDLISDYFDSNLHQLFLQQIEHKIHLAIAYATSSRNPDRHPFKTNNPMTENNIKQVFSEFGSNGRTVILNWIKLAGMFHAPTRVKDLDVCEGKKDNLGKLNLSKLAHAFRLKENKKFCMVTTGSDYDIISFLLCNITNLTDRSANMSNENFVALDDLQLNTAASNVSFPWKNGCCSHWEKTYDSKEFTNLKKELTAKKILVHQHKFLIHYGISAFIMVGILRKAEKNKKAKDSEKYMGKRIAKYFYSPDGVDLYYGSVEKVDIKHDGFEWFHIKYDDGDSEHMRENELHSCLELYEKFGTKRRRIV